MPSRVSPKPTINSPPSPPSKPKRILAGVLLGLLLLQVLCFFLGLQVPLNRIITLWGKSVEQRRQMLGPADAAIEDVSVQLPLNARVYLMDPEAMSHKHSVYYFYPRYVAISMTSRSYEGIYEKWDERPSPEWLATNQFTHVLSYKEQRLTALKPVSPQL